MYAGLCNIARMVLVVGFAASTAFEPRDSYRRNAELSVYVAPSCRGSGAGKLAIVGLIDRARASGFWKLLSGAFTDNVASLRILRSVGFWEVGVYEKQAQLECVWKDVTIIERIVGPEERDRSSATVPR